MAGRRWSWSILVCVAIGAGACDDKARSRAYTSDAFASDDAAVVADAADAMGVEGGFAQAIFPMLQAAGCGTEACHTMANLVARHWALTTPEDTYRHWVLSPGFDHCDPNGNAINAPTPSFDNPRIAPGDADRSMVIKKLTDPWEMCGLFYGHMPPSPSPRLPAEQIDRIRTWILAGAPF